MKLEVLLLTGNLVDNCENVIKLFTMPVIDAGDAGDAGALPALVESRIREEL